MPFSFNHFNTLWCDVRIYVSVWECERDSPIHNTICENWSKFGRSNLVTSLVFAFSEIERGQNLKKICFNTILKTQLANKKSRENSYNVFV
jgi:hypothetical protein